MRSFSGMSLPLVAVAVVESEDAFCIVLRSRSHRMRTGRLRQYRSAVMRAEPTEGGSPAARGRYEGRLASLS